MIVVQWIAFIYMTLCTLLEFVKIFSDKEISGRIASFIVCVLDLSITIILFNTIFGSL